MIKPEELKQKALNLYPAWQSAWIEADEPFFPHVMRCDKRLDDNLAVAVESIQRLRAGSKEQLGYGYTIEWTERKSRRHGLNLFPERILFQTADDFLQFIGKRREFSLFTAAVEQLRNRIPQLIPWIRQHRREIVQVADDLDGLLKVVEYFLAHPRPGLYARELPIPVDTKFIERNQNILRDWLDIVLPPHTIRADEKHFARRFGLQYADPLILIRFLDDTLREQSGLPWKELAVPLHSLAATPLACERVVIVENKINLLTLPALPGTLALGGLGNAVTDLRYLLWLAEKELWYWGDIDVAGFEILSRLRAIFPHARSILMDGQTIHDWRNALGATVRASSSPPPPGLTSTERLACEICLNDGLRIEQEQIPQSYVQQAFTTRRNLPPQTPPTIHKPPTE